MGAYIEVVFTIISEEDFVGDILMNSVAEIGFDSFESTDLGFKAYIPSKNFKEDELQAVLQQYNGVFTFSYDVNLIPYKNWNEVWESNFQPIIIADQVYVYANFHELKNYPITICINPKMAFGTGHHETTFQMAEVMLGLDFAGKQVLDMGCGTGLLAILADKMGASKITAIDNDEQASASCEENAVLNNLDNATILCGDASTLVGMSFDIILANINRNILLNDMQAYASSLRNNGLILFSGFYNEDLPLIQAEANLHGLVYLRSQSKNNWVVATFIKKENEE